MLPFNLFRFKVLDLKPWTNPDPEEDKQLLDLIKLNRRHGVVDYDAVAAYMPTRTAAECRER